MEGIRLAQIHREQAFGQVRLHPESEARLVPGQIHKKDRLEQINADQAEHGPDDQRIATNLARIADHRTQCRVAVNKIEIGQHADRRDDHPDPQRFQCHAHNHQAQQQHGAALLAGSQQCPDPVNEGRFFHRTDIDRPGLAKGFSSGVTRRS